MANLLDAIRGNNQPQQQGMTDETSKLQQLLRAKSGKALDTGSSGLGASSLGEQAAVSQANQQLSQQILPQQALQSQQQQQQARGATQQFGLQSQQIAQGQQFDNQKNQLQIDSVLKDLERNKGQVDLAKDKSQLDQVAQTLRLQNQQYVDNLTREGSRARLDNDVGFKEAFQSAVFKDASGALKDKQAQAAILSANERDFNKQLNEMGMSTAYDTFRNELESARTAAVAGAVSGSAQAGASYYGSSGSGGAK